MHRILVNEPGDNIFTISAQGEVIVWEINDDGAFVQLDGLPAWNAVAESRTE